MEIREITVPLADVPGGLTFGPVTLDERPWDESADRAVALPVVFALESCRVMGLGWYRAQYRTLGVISVTADRITLRPTASVQITRAAWWRRCGYWVFTRWCLAVKVHADSRRPVFRR